MLRSALRGIAATVVMSLPMAVRWAAQPRVPPPPMIVAERAQRALGLQPEERGPIVRHATWVAAHLGFGASLAAASRIWPRRPGEAYGTAVWAANYALALPAVGLYPPLTRDSRARAIETFASHLVFGAALRKLAQ